MNSINNNFQDVLDKDLTEDEIILALLRKDKMTSFLADNISNKIYNLGFMEGADADKLEYKQNKWKKLISSAFKKDFYRGIVVGLILNSKHNMMEPFFPLQDFPEQSLKVQSITEDLEKSYLGLHHLRKQTRKNRKRKYITS